MWSQLPGELCTVAARGETRRSTQPKRREGGGLRTQTVLGRKLPLETEPWAWLWGIPAETHRSWQSGVSGVRGRGSQVLLPSGCRGWIPKTWARVWMKGHNWMWKKKTRWLWKVSWSRWGCYQPNYRLWRKKFKEMKRWHTFWMLDSEPELSGSAW